MEFTAEQIAGILEGEIQGNPEAKVSKLAKIEEGENGTLTFLANPKYTPHIYTTKATITIVNKDFEPENDITTTLIKVDDAYKSFSKLLAYYNEVKNNKSGIESPSFIADSSKHGENLYLGAFSYVGENVTLGNNVKIYPHAYIGDNSTIGDNTTVFSGAKLYSETVIGNNCTINSGAIIGADGFGYAPDENGEFQKVPQIGNVILEDNVDIGAAATIDRATLGSTIIRKGVKIDNQVQIAHNVEIDQHTVIAAQTGIAGSTKIGKYCMFGGQVGVAGHLTLGNHLKVQAQSGIGHRAKDGEKLYGSPAINYGNYVKSYVHFKNLPSIVSQLNKLEKKINNNE
jgi:UDP-3-O-[3-hydroxymyristoyl] glucosamine N-acyltransferase